MRENGYVITIKAFVPVSKTDFKQQAATAEFMSVLTSDKSIPEEFNDDAVITDISAKYGSRETADVVAGTDTPATE